VVVALLYAGSGEEIFFIWFGSGVLNYRFECKIELPDFKELLKASLEKIVVVVFTGKVSVNEYIHTIFKFLKQIFGTVKLGLEVVERNKHYIFFIENFLHLVGNILAQHLYQFVNSSDVIANFWIS
jgi:hypothetical protein